jgi:hypothetical protein
MDILGGMFRNLSPYAIGIHKPLTENVKLAKLGDFQGVEVDMNEVLKLAEESSINYVRSTFRDMNVKPGGWGLPFEWRGDVDAYKRGLVRLSHLASVAFKNRMYEGFYVDSTVLR